MAGGTGRAGGPVSGRERWSPYESHPLRRGLVEVGSFSEIQAVGSKDSYELRAIKSLFSRREQRTRVRRTKRGMVDKSLRGEVFGGFRARYGFEFVKALNPKGREVNVGYRVDLEKMATVGRIFRMVADGASLHEVSRTLEGERVPNPSGGPRWSRNTIKGFVRDDIYRPHTSEEIEALVPPGVAATIDPERVYGVHWSGRKRGKFASSRGKARTVYEAPREEWVGIPIDLTGSRLDRATVDRARAVVEDNKASSKLLGRVWELSGLLRCAECGRLMNTDHRAKKSGGNNFYYRCRPSSTVDKCENRKTHRAATLEYEAAKAFEMYASRGALLEAYDRAVAERKGNAGHQANLKRRTSLAEKLAELDLERRGYLKQNARGVLTDAELDDMFSEVDEQREAVRAELRAAEDEAATTRRIEEARESLSCAAWYDPVHAEWYEDPDAVQPHEYLTLAASPAEIHRTFRRYGARFEVDRGGRSPSASRWI